MTGRRWRQRTSHRQRIHLIRADEWLRLAHGLSAKAHAPAQQRQRQEVEMDSMIRLATGTVLHKCFLLRQRMWDGRVHHWARGPERQCKRLFGRHHVEDVEPCANLAVHQHYMMVPFRLMMSRRGQQAWARR